MSFWKTPTRPSPAMVVALIALLASLAGTATAAKVLITSKDIKNGTIRLVDLNKQTRNNSLLMLDAPRMLTSPMMLVPLIPC